MEQAPATSPCRVLVVDDYPDTAESMATLLRLWGHDVRIAHDGPAALSLADIYRPEVILLDIGLPGLDGYEVVRRLRQRPPLGHALVVGLSGYGQEADCRQSLEAGCDFHLLKPVDLEVLQSMLKDCHKRRPENSSCV